MKKIRQLRTALLFLTLGAMISCTSGKTKEVREYYDLRIYHISGASQMERTDAYLRDVYIPALHRAGIEKVGVFKPVESDTAFGKRIYIFIPFKDARQYAGLPEVLLNDQVYKDAAGSFTDAPVNDPPYMRLGSIFMKAFKDMPVAVAPKFATPVGERIYELRSYESATEAKAAKKIKMFNEGGEIALFHKLDFNVVFFGEVLSGTQMPNLMYMTSFSDTTSNKEHWKAFVGSPEWKEMSGLEEYANTVSRIHVNFLHPAEYSEF